MVQFNQRKYLKTLNAWKSIPDSWERCHSEVSQNEKGLFKITPDNNEELQGSIFRKSSFKVNSEFVSIETLIESCISYTI